MRIVRKKTGFSSPGFRLTDFPPNGGDCKGNGTPAISGKSGLVKYYDLARFNSAEQRHCFLIPKYPFHTWHVPGFFQTISSILPPAPKNCSSLHSPWRIFGGFGRLIFQAPPQNQHHKDRTQKKRTLVTNQ